MSDTFNPLSEIKLGDEVKGEERRYVVERWIGTGSTAVVYLATDVESHQPVALKVLRPDASAEGAVNFWEEGLNLGLLRQKLPNSSAIPGKYDQQRAGSPRFLALELVPSHTYLALDDVLERDVLPEDEALELAAQALEVLHTLHSELHRTYTDFQFKNLRWNRETRCLKIMDWGHVSDDFSKTPDSDKFATLAQQDLARLSTYLYRLLTSKAAREAGDTAYALQKRGAERWACLSVGTRQLVTRGLHPTPALRFASAEAFLKEVREQQRLLGPWPDEQKALYRAEFRDILRQVEEEWKSDPSLRPLTSDKWQRMDRANQLFDALKRHEEYDSVSERLYEEKLASILQGQTGEWARGRRLFEARQFEAAYDIWQAEAQARGDPKLWRWVEAAKAGPALGELHGRWGDLLSHVETEAWDAAAAMLAEAHLPEPVCSAVRAIDAEVQAAQAAQKLPGAAAPAEKFDLLRVMAEARPDIPYWPLLAEERGWLELDQQIQQLKNKLEAQQKASTDVEGWRSELAAGTVNAANRARLLQRWQAAFEQATPSDQSALAQMCLAVVREGSPPDAEDGSLSWYLKIAETTAFYGSDDNPELRQAVADLRRRLKERQRGRVIELALERLEQAHRDHDLAAFTAVVLPESIQETERFRQLRSKVRAEFETALDTYDWGHVIERSAWLERLDPGGGHLARIAELQARQSRAISDAEAKLGELDIRYQALEFEYTDLHPKFQQANEALTVYLDVVALARDALMLFNPDSVRRFEEAVDGAIAGLPDAAVFPERNEWSIRLTTLRNQLKGQASQERARQQVKAALTDAKALFGALDDDALAEARARLIEARAALAGVPDNDDLLRGEVATLQQLSEQMHAYLTRFRELEKAVARSEADMKATDRPTGSEWRTLAEVDRSVHSDLLIAAAAWERQCRGLYFSRIDNLRERLDILRETALGRLEQAVAATESQSPPKAEPAIKSAVENIATMPVEQPALPRASEPPHQAPEAPQLSLRKSWLAQPLSTGVALVIIAVALMPVLLLLAWSALRSDQSFRMGAELQTQLAGVPLQATVSVTLAEATTPSPSRATPATAVTTPSPEVPTSTSEQPTTTPEPTVSPTTGPTIPPVAVLPIQAELAPRLWSLPDDVFYDLPPLELQPDATDGAAFNLVDSSMLQLQAGGDPLPLELALVDADGQYWNGVTGQMSVERVVLSGTFTQTASGTWAWLPALDEPRVAAGAYSVQISTAGSSATPVELPITITAPADEHRAYIWPTSPLLISDTPPGSSAARTESDDDDGNYLVLGKTRDGEYLRVMLEDRRRLFWVKPVNALLPSDHSISVDVTTVPIIEP